MDAQHDCNDRVGLRVTAFSAMGKFVTKSNLLPWKAFITLKFNGQFLSLGSRKYQEDTFSVAYQKSDGSDGLDYAYFGIFDG